LEYYEIEGSVSNPYTNDLPGDKKELRDILEGPVSNPHTNYSPKGPGVIRDIVLPGHMSQRQFMRLMDFTFNRYCMSWLDYFVKMMKKDGLISDTRGDINFIKGTYQLLQLIKEDQNELAAKERKAEDRGWPIDPNLKELDYETIKNAIKYGKYSKYF
jgi:hypothetical protein